MTARAYRTWQWLHRWSSLVATGFLLLLCVSGLPLIFAHEIDHLTGNEVELPVVAPGADVPLDAILADARGRRPGDVVRFATRDDEDPLWFIALGAQPAQGATTALLTYDARTGALLRDKPLRSPFMWLMVRLHTDLFAGVAGSLFLGAMGLLLLVAMVSGVFLYGPSMGRRAFGAVRVERTRRVRWLDLHNLLGIGTLVWLLVVGATGALLTLAKPMYAQWQDGLVPTRQGPVVRSGHASLDEVLRTATGNAAGMQVAFVAFPGTRWAEPQGFTVFLRGSSTVTSRVIEPQFFDARSGAFLRREPMPWQLFALRLSAPLHFGDYAGLPMKVLWALLDLAAIVVLATGLFLWWPRKRAAGRGRR